MRRGEGAGRGSRAGLEASTVQGQLHILLRISRVFILERHECSGGEEEEEERRKKKKCLIYFILTV